MGLGVGIGGLLALANNLRALFYTVWDGPGHQVHALGFQLQGRGGLRFGAWGSVYQDSPLNYQDLPFVVGSDSRHQYAIY